MVNDYFYLDYGPDNDYPGIACVDNDDNRLNQQIRGLKVTSWHFPDIKESIDKVDLRRAIMLAAAYEILERLIG